MNERSKESSRRVLLDHERVGKKFIPPLRQPMFDAREAWNALAADYERARTAIDSLDTLVEWPAQRAFVGDVEGKSVLDLGCGSGEKALYFADAGADSVVGVDISDYFIDAARVRLRTHSVNFHQGDLNALYEVESLKGRRFDVIVCLQALSYSDNLTNVLTAIRSLLKPGGRIVISFTSPVRYQRDEPAMSMGVPAARRVRYASTWNSDIVLEHAAPSMSDRLNAIAEAGLYVSRSEEPAFPKDLEEKHASKSKWWSETGGIILWELRAR